MRRVRQLRNSRGYDDRHREALVGFDFFHVFRTDAEQAIAWHDLRDELLEQWIQDKPFTRPDVWWRYDAPELRRCTNGVHPFDRPAFIDYCREWEAIYPDSNITECTKKTWYGVPCIWGPPELDGTAEFETERAYLERLDLLTDHERQLLDAAPAGSATVT